jgi:hypothetical protein
MRDKAEHICKRGMGIPITQRLKESSEAYQERLN